MPGVVGADHQGNGLGLANAVKLAVLHPPDDVLRPVGAVAGHQGVVRIFLEIFVQNAQSPAVHHPKLGDRVAHQKQRGLVLLEVFLVGKETLIPPGRRAFALRHRGDGPDRAESRGGRQKKRQDQYAFFHFICSLLFQVTLSIKGRNWPIVSAGRPRRRSLPWSESRRQRRDSREDFRSRPGELPRDPPRKGRSS